MTTEVKGTVLVVEDSLAFRNVFRNVLEASGYRVLEAEDGKKGLDMAKRKKPDAILLDLVLPEMEGFEVLRRIRSSRVVKTTPVILLSTMGTRDNIQKAIDMGADDFAVKGSASPKEIVNKIASLVAKAGSKRQGDSYHVSLKEGRDDIARLAKAMGLANLLKCPQCGGELRLELIADDEADSEGHWFSAHFTCIGCSSDL